MISIERIREVTRHNTERFTVFISSLIETHRTAFFVSTGAILVCALIGLIMFAFFSTNAKKNISKTPEKIDIEFSELFLPPEPGITNDIRLSREQLFQWGDAEKKRWFIEPNDEMIRQLEKAHNTLIGDILQSIP